MVSSAKSPDFVKSVAKALAVLRIMNERQTPLTISEIAKDVGISRASARRLLVTLEELDPKGVEALLDASRCRRSR